MVGPSTFVIVNHGTSALFAYVKIQSQPSTAVVLSIIPRTFLIQKVPGIEGIYQYVSPLCVLHPYLMYNNQYFDPGQSGLLGP